MNIVIRPIFSNINPTCILTSLKAISYQFVTKLKVTIQVLINWTAEKEDSVQIDKILTEQNLYQFHFKNLNRYAVDSMV